MLILYLWLFLIGHFTLVGGHTAEMLNLLSVLQKDRFSPRIYIAAATDNMSLQKARLFENSLAVEVDFCFFISTLFFLAFPLVSQSMKGLCFLKLNASQIDSPSGSSLLFFCIVSGFVQSHHGLLLNLRGNDF